MKRGFIDETVISVTGGDGGNGIVSFLRERARPHGGPNGGNGGRGGNVLVVADRHVKTLLELSRRRRIVAVNGKHGEGSDRHGAGGVDTRILVPVGTRVLDADTGYLHADLLCDQDNTLLAAGGHGGFGNAHFKSSVNQAPRRCTAGETGEERRFRLELRLLANVGFLGLPNAGKSSLLRALSAAKPKVAAYPFTTLSPQLGVIDGGDTKGEPTVAPSFFSIKRTLSNALASPATADNDSTMIVSPAFTRYCFPPVLNVAVVCSVIIFSGKP
jgi:GTP-binding protein